MTERIYVTADEIDTCATDRQSQDTAICWSRDDQILSINTSDNTFITKMKNVMSRDPESYKCFYYKGNIDKKTGRVYAYVFEVDKKLLSFRIASTKKELTEEEKLTIANRLNNSRNS